MQKYWQNGGVALSIVVMTAQIALAESGTTLDGATTTFSALFSLGLALLGLAGLTTIAYTVARNRYGVVWDEALSIIFAVAIGASGTTILGWVGSSAASEVVQTVCTFPTEILSLLP